MTCFCFRRIQQELNELHLSAVVLLLDISRFKASLNPCCLVSVCWFLAARLAPDRSCWDLCLVFCLTEICQELINKEWFKLVHFWAKCSSKLSFSLHPSPTTGMSFNSCARLTVTVFIVAMSLCCQAEVFALGRGNQRESSGPAPISSTPFLGAQVWRKPFGPGPLLKSCGLHVGEVRLLDTENALLLLLGKWRSPTMHKSRPWRQKSKFSITYLKSFVSQEWSPSL